MLFFTSATNVKQEFVNLKYYYKFAENPQPLSTSLNTWINNTKLEIKEIRKTEKEKNFESRQFIQQLAQKPM